MSDHVDPNIAQMIEILQSESDHHFKPKEVQSRLDDLMDAAGFFYPPEPICLRKRSNMA